MKVLILSCNTGQGHNSVSKAITESFSNRDVVCDTADALSFVSEWASKTVCDWHTRLYRYFPKVSGTGYGYIEQHPKLFEDRSPIHRLLMLGVDKLYSYISDGEYEIIICPHVISALMLTELRKSYPEAKLLTAFIATDYTCAPMTEESDLDLYFLPDESLRKDYENIDIAHEKIVITDGIPVRASFYNCIDKAEAKRRIGLPENVSHAVMMFGSMGCGPMPKLTDLISQKIPDNSHLTVVCGTNEQIYKRISKESENKKNVTVLGYTKDISLLMDSADLFITKPGGISTAEASVKRLPMLLYNAVSGCEQSNFEHFCALGAAVTADGEENISQLCAELLRDPERLQKMASGLKERKNAAEEIVEAMLSGFKSSGPPPKIGNEFVFWRKRCGLSQLTMSKLFGIPRRTLRGWESGESSPPVYLKRLVIAELKRIARAQEKEENI